ncbi:hypothetical protein HAX54_049794, partial [Datura stramonium]|nr:hypothetical protein [Datura stramonium]
MNPSLFLLGFELGLKLQFLVKLGFANSGRLHYNARRASIYTLSLESRTYPCLILPACHVGHDT